MISELFIVELWVSGLAAVFNFFWGGILKRLPAIANLALVGLVELTMIAQVIATIALLVGGQKPNANLFEFLGYLLVAFLVPAAALFWSLVEKTRYSSIVLAVASFVVLVMSARMNQLWFG